MKRLLTKYGMIVLSVAVVVAILLSAMTFFSSTSAAFPNLLGVLASPFRQAGAAVTGTVEGWMQYFTDYDALVEENRQLKEQLAEMEASIRQAEYDREENQRLRELLDLRQQRRELTFESALIVEEDASNWASMLTVNKGTAHNVSVGDCAIDEFGHLVGVVTEAGLNWSTVRTLLDSETSIGALVVRSDLTAVAQGDFALMSEGRLQLNYLGAQSDVMAGDLIVTSGLGDYYPSQLVIGYVEEVGTSDDGLAQYAVIRPQAEPEDLTQLFIITDFTIVD